ncbi:Mitochondria-eating protein [Fasciola hepatica]|uniref:Mitochondria-eating protein n=1 Tax=Fasciola hepatica TaxID=6192 RepID=A0A4E0RCI8_FASHE|nr:Mitochondria-eating protein [Fasciola hepatica]
MAESLRQLINSAAFLVLHENLEKWLKLYHVNRLLYCLIFTKKNTCDENIATGCELIELNARLQGQLFRLLSICATEGGLYGGASAIKSRLLPLLGSGLGCSGLNSSISMSALNASSSRVMELDELKRAYAKSLEKIEVDMGQPSRTGAEVQSLEEQNERLQARLFRGTMDEQGSRKQTNSTKNLLVKPMTESDLFDDVSGPQQISGISPLSPLDPVQRNRQQNLIARFNDLFSSSRVEAMAILRRYLDDYDMNQMIVFQVVLEAFSVARTHVRAYRSRVRAKVASTSSPPTTDKLDELMQSYLNVHATYAIDLPAMTHEVLLAMERHVPRIRRPSTALGFEVINDFIQEVCKFAWECMILAHPLDVYRPVCVNEVIDENKYRRSHDSSYSVVLVHHHIWPCLMLDGHVVSKGEACTKRGKSMGPIRATSPDPKARTTKSRPIASNARSCSPERQSSSPSAGNSTSSVQA